MRCRHHHRSAKATFGRRSVWSPTCSDVGHSPATPRLARSLIDVEVQLLQLLPRRAREVLRRRLRARAHPARLMRVLRASQREQAVRRRRRHRGKRKRKSDTARCEANITVDGPGQLRARARKHTFGTATAGSVPAVLCHDSCFVPAVLCQESWHKTVVPVVLSGSFAPAVLCWP
jgi:hypothetical protein